MKQPRGRGALLLFLDYDGVLSPERVFWHPKTGPYIHSSKGHTLFEHALLLEYMLKPYPDVQIVLSTAWAMRASPEARIRLNIRAGYGFAKALKRLPLGLQRRVIGGTYHSTMDWEQFKDAPRGMQVWSDVLRRQPQDWLALDDDYLHWPAWCRDKYIRTDEENGLAEPVVRKEFEAKLAAMVERAEAAEA